MKKTKCAAMAAAVLLSVGACLGISPALARYQNTEQLFTTHTAENRSLTVEAGEGSYFTGSGAAYLVTVPSEGSHTLPFLFTNNGKDAKVVRISSSTAVGSSADEVFILDPAEAAVDPEKGITDPVIKGTVSRHTHTYQIPWTLNPGTYTVSVEVFEAAEVTLIGVESDTDGDNTPEPDGDTEPSVPATQAAEDETPPPAELPTDGDDTEEPSAPQEPLIPAENNNKSTVAGSAKPYITLRAVFVVQTGNTDAVTVEPLLTVTGSGYSVSGTNGLEAAVSGDISAFSYSVWQYVSTEQTKTDESGTEITVKVPQWQQVIPLPAGTAVTEPDAEPTEDTRSEAQKVTDATGFTVTPANNRLSVTNAEGKARAGLYRLQLTLPGEPDFPLYVPFFVNYRLPAPQASAGEDIPTVTG